MTSIASRQRGAWIETGKYFCCIAQPKASPLGNEGRGLKPFDFVFGGNALQRIASRQRGAWIETGGKRRFSAAFCGIASRQRGAWIETACHLRGHRPDLASPLGNEGRGLKRERHAWLAFGLFASPLGNEGRGLKRATRRIRADRLTHRLSATRGVD